VTDCNISPATVLVMVKPIVCCSIREPPVYEKYLMLAVVGVVEIGFLISVN
jgi:hypothetical protein